MKPDPSLATVVRVAAVAAVAPLCFAQTDSPSEPKKAKFLYHDGFSVGQNIDSSIPALSLDDDEENEAIRSFSDASKEDASAMTEQLVESLQTFIDNFRQQEADEASANIERGKAFRAAFAQKKGVMTTQSGLMYRVLSQGEGRTYDRTRDGEEAIVSVTYEGKTLDGTTFDLTDRPIRMGINQAVPGFTEALKTMPVGSEWEICLPPDLAYGEQAPAPIGSHATLIFTLKLHDIITLPLPAS